MAPVRVGVADRVGQRLLDDAVGGQVDARGERARGAHDLELDGEPGAAYLVEHAAELAERGRRRRLRRSDGPRSTPSSRRSSVRARRAVSPMISTERRACAGLSGSSDVAASACTAIRLTWWATTSCSSRAIRARSAAASRDTTRSSSASARSARPCAASRFARLARLSVPGHPRRDEDHRLEDGLVGLAMAGRGQGDGDARHRKGDGDPPPHGAAAVDDRVERDRGPQRERREPESDLVVGDPRGSR